MKTMTNDECGMRNGRDRIPLTTKEAAQRASAAVAQWNELYPPETPVRVYRLFGSEDTAFNTTTRSPAWAAGGVSARVLVKGISGGMALTHVKPLCGHSESTLHPTHGVFQLDQCLAAIIGDELESGVAS